MVCRWTAVADVDCTHDSYTQGSVLPKHGILAGTDNDILDYGYRHLCTILLVWRIYRSDPASMDLFPLAGRYPARLLYADAGTEGALYPCIQTLVIKQYVKHFCGILAFIRRMFRRQKLRL